MCNRSKPVRDSLAPPRPSTPRAGSGPIKVAWAVFVLGWLTMGGRLVAPEAFAQAGEPAPTPPEEAQRFEYRQLHMGVEARLVLYADSQAQADFAASRAYERLAQLEACWSHWRADSELSRLVAQAGQGPIRISSDLFRVLSLARGLAEVSGGAFDATGAPLYQLWSQARASGNLPSTEELAEARERVGWQRLRLDAANSTAELQPGTELDLSGIGKGFAADELGEVLRHAGAARSLIEIGGDLVLGDEPPGSRGWRVLAGSGQQGGRDEALLLRRCGIATSGDAEQAVEVSGRRHSHLIDPRSGAAMTHGHTVTVLAETGGLADALATAASVLERGAAERLIDRFPGAQIFFEPPPGTPSEPWTELFDGHSLAGWVTSGGRYDGPAPWTVEEGVLVGRSTADGEGGLIYTERLYSNFEIEFEVCLDYPFDSGLFVRMLPPDFAPEAASAAPWPADQAPRRDLKGAQVTLDHRDGGEIAAIYADGFLQHNPEAVQHFKRNEWNRVRARVSGFDFRIQTWINEQPVGDYQLPADSPGFAPFGRIGLQVHPSDPKLKDQRVRFRGLRLRPLPMFPEEQWGQWTDMLAAGLEGFNYSGGSEGYLLEEGVLSIPAEGGGQIESRSDHADFCLRADFRIARMANSGLFLRAARDGSNPAYSGMEIQVLDDFHWEAETQSTLAPYQKTGGLYGAFPPGPAKDYRPVGEWNLIEVLCRGNRLAVALNGQALYDLDLSRIPADPPLIGRASTGFLGWQRYGAPRVILPWAIQVKNWRVLDLPANAR
jgi:FAD:protein FMN transferase